MARPNASSLEDLFTRWQQSILSNTFFRAVVSDPTEPGQAIERLLIRLVDLRGQVYLAITSRQKRQDEVRNHTIPEGLAWLRAQLSTQYRQALLCTAEADWQWVGIRAETGKLIRHKPSQTNAPSRLHDEKKRSPLDDDAEDWLKALGILDSEGKLRASRADKHRQVHRYLEVLLPLIKGLALDPGRPMRIADMGSGRGYLTFAVWHLFHRILKQPVRVIGVESREGLVQEGNDLAKQVAAVGLEFRFGNIETIPVEPLDVLIALHACNTATDHAIQRGIEAGVQLILLAPCCHQELRPLMQDPEVLKPLLSHGILKQRLAEWLTDGMRALTLQAAGYQTQVFEFIDSGHTPKNLMISAVRNRDQPHASAAAAAKDLLALKQFFGLQRG